MKFKNRQKKSMIDQCLLLWGKCGTEVYRLQKGTLSGVMVMSCVFIQMLAMVVFVETHKTVYLRFGYFTLCNYYVIKLVILKKIEILVILEGCRGL